MRALISSYSPTAETIRISNYQTYTVDYDLNTRDELFGSIVYYNPVSRGEAEFNGRILELLCQIKSLNDNWDEDGAIAPSPNVLQRAEGFVHLMNAIGQQIYNIAPGPKGEIMLDFRNGNKSLEIIIYSDKTKFVKFPEKALPSQGIYNSAALLDLMVWLNVD